MSHTKEQVLKVAEKHFPFEKPNPGQMDAIVSAAMAVLNETHKHILIQAPTGIGKSIVAITAHRVIQELSSRWRTTIITTTKGLQDQYSTSNLGLFDLRGKKNYPCQYKVGPYNSGGCRTNVKSGGCKPKVECAYVKTREEWCNQADIRLTNHSFQIEACPMICMDEKNKANMIVIDECHELDANIVEHTKLDIDTYDLRSLFELGQKTFLLEIVGIVNSYNAHQPGVAHTPTVAERESIREIAYKAEALWENFLDQIDEGASNKNTLASAVEALQQIADKMHIYADNDAMWIITEYEKNKKLVLKPVHASTVSKMALFRKADFFIHMSATICGFQTYLDVLGVPIDQTLIIDVENPIPVESRKVVVNSQLKVSGQGTDFAKLTAMVDGVVRKHTGQAGIIHTVSFKLAEEIKSRSSHEKRMLITGNHDEAKKHLMNKGIVLSPSLENGFDAKDDIARWQIIAKVPYGYLGDPLVKLHSEFNKDWYARKTVLRLVQACGRAVRGVDDHAVTYILDNSFLTLLKNNIDLFPGWFLDALEPA